MASFKLTVRNGPKVWREDHATLDEALAAMRGHAELIRTDADPEAVSAFRRKYEAGDQVVARLEISTGGPFRGRDAGLDVMGDGSLVPFRGGVSRKEISAKRDAAAYEAVEQALR
jgi:hypothetical protein